MNALLECRGAGDLPVVLGDQHEVQRHDQLDIADAIHVAYEGAQRDHRSAVDHAIRCGTLLLQAKAAVAHGKWDNWLKANVRFSSRSAQGYMRLARMAPAKAQRVADLSLRRALESIGDEYQKKQRLLEKKVDRELRVAAKQVVHEGTAVRIDDGAAASPTGASTMAPTDDERPCNHRLTPSKEYQTYRTAVDEAAITIGRWFASVDPTCHRILKRQLVEIVRDEWVKAQSKDADA